MLSMMMMNQQQQRSDALVDSIPVIDPASRNCPKAFIPLAYIMETKGSHEYIRCKGKNKKDTSLCLLFQQGRCTMGARCGQIHADPSYIAQFRLDAFRGVLNTCCAGHGDAASTDAAFLGMIRGVEIILVDSKQREHQVSALQIAKTDALMSRIELAQSEGQNAIKVHVFQTCKSHFENRCKHGHQCKNIHVCRELYGFFYPAAQSQPMVPCPPSQPQNQSAAAGGSNGDVFPSLHPIAPQQPMIATSSTTTAARAHSVATRTTSTTSSMHTACSLPPLVPSQSPCPSPMLPVAPRRPSLPAPPSRRSSKEATSGSTGSPTVLKRFLRKWQQPDVNSSCGSSRTSMEKCVPKGILASQDLTDSTSFVQLDF